MEVRKERGTGGLLPERITADAKVSYVPARQGAGIAGPQEEPADPGNGHPSVGAGDSAAGHDGHEVGPVLRRSVQVANHPVGWSRELTNGLGREIG